jgi:hypothetical protein
MGPATPAHAHVARQGLSGDRRKARSKAELELVFQAVTTAGSVPCPSPFAGDDLEQTHIGSLGFVSWRLITPRNNAEWRTFLKLRDRVADGGRLRGYAGPPFPYSQDPAVVGLTIVSAARHSNRRIESRRRRSFRRLDSSAPSSRGRRPIAHGLQIVRAQPTAMASAVGHDRIIFAGLPPSVRTQRCCKTPRTTHHFRNFNAEHALFSQAMPPDRSLEADMPIILWLLGVPLVVVVLLMLTHII